MSRTQRPRILPLALAAVVGCLGAIVLGSADADASPARSAFVAVAPCRLVDTREPPLARPGAGETVVVDVAGRCGIDGVSAVAAALTVTAVRPARPGFLTVFPAGSARPVASAVNYGTGEAIANLQLMRLGDGGRVAIYTSAASDVVVDVTGYFVEVDGPVSEGRFVPLTAQRLVDTRSTGRPRAGDVVHVGVRLPDDAVAAVVNLTTTATVGPDFLTAYPAGERRPRASVLNVDGSGETRAAAAIVPLSSSGFDVFTKTGNHVIVDLVGYVTGPSSPPSEAGLFVASGPTRLVDTRRPAAGDGGPRLWDHGGREFDTSRITGGGVAAVAANIVAVHTEDRGFLVAYPAGTARPATSTLNYDAAQTTIANSAIVPVSDRGIAVHSIEATHVVVDITGWFTGSPVRSSHPVPANEPPATRRVTIIGDSAIAGIRWNGALAGLQGFEPVTKLESCRRLVEPSCRGREGYRPLTAQHEILALPAAGPEDILVVATGYNDWHEGFSSDFDAVVSAARWKGFHHIMWVDYRSHVGYTLPSSGGTRSNYGEMNRVLAAKLASGDYPDVRRWELDRYTRGAVDWFHADGVHETVLGSWGVADWISRHVRAFDDKPCVHTWSPGRRPDDPCPNPDPLPAWLGRPDIPAIYGL